MKLSKAAKLILIALSIVPAMYMLLFFANFAFLAGGGDDSDEFMFDHFAWFFAIHLGVMFLIFALIAFYIVFLFKTDAVKTDLKALWAVVLFYGRATRDAGVLVSVHLAERSNEHGRSARLTWKRPAAAHDSSGARSL